MSHFVCPKCGMTNIDCGREGYKTEREIELEQQVKCLQEQLNEANKVLSSLITPQTPSLESVINYLEKCGLI